MAGKPAGDVAAALLLMQAGTNTMDVYSALNSSPWTAENFGADPAKAKSCMELVWHSAAWSTAYCAGGAWVAQSWWPIIGGVINNAYLYWLYRRALNRGRTSGSAGWASGDGGGGFHARS